MMNNRLLANICFAASLIISITTVIAVATDTPALKWTRGYGLVAVVLVFIGAALKRKGA